MIRRIEEWLGRAASALAENSRIGVAILLGALVLRALALVRMQGHTVGLDGLSLETDLGLAFVRDAARLGFASPA